MSRLTVNLKGGSIDLQRDGEPRRDRVAEGVRDRRREWLPRYLPLCETWIRFPGNDIGFGFSGNEGKLKGWPGYAPL